MFSLNSTQVNWVSDTVPHLPFRGLVKIRYRATAVPALIEPVGPAQALVRFDQPVFGITPGQGAVFYVGEECVGGGTITNEER